MHNHWIKIKAPLLKEACLLWLRQESNLDLELRKLLYYPLYYEAGVSQLLIVNWSAIITSQYYKPLTDNVSIFPNAKNYCQIFLLQWPAILHQKIF